MDGAGAAFAEITALLGARQFQMLAQQVEQRGARIDRHLVNKAIDAQNHGQMRPKFHALTSPAFGSVHGVQKHSRVSSPRGQASSGETFAQNITRYARIVLAALFLERSCKWRPLSR